MKISNISIKNYRSCVNTTFSPHKSLSVLIGPNGSGKTNILSAIRLLPALCYTRYRHYGSEELPISSASELKVTYENDGLTITQTAKINIVTNEKNQDEIIKTGESWYMPDVTGNRKRIAVPSAFLAEIYQVPGTPSYSHHIRSRSNLGHYIRSQGIDLKAIDHLQRVFEFVTRINYYSASQFTNPGSCPISFDVEGGESKRRTGISITGHKKFLFDVYQEYLKKSDIYLEFISLVGPDGIGLIESVDFKEIKTSSSNYSVMTGGKVIMKEKINLLVVPSFKISGNSLSPSQLSEGTFKTLALIFYLVTDKSSLLMIEEPEVCVHHGLLNSIVELIKIYSKEKQIFISTHSDSVLDKVDVDNVFKVRRTKEAGTETSNIKKRMGAKDLAALKSYLLNEGSLGEFWKHGDLENV